MSGPPSEHQSGDEQNSSASSKERTRFRIGTLILIGLTIGFIGALYYAWILEPVVYVAAGPSQLNDRYEREYLLLVSESFAAGGNWQLAQERLAALDDPNIQMRVSQELESYLRGGEPAARMRNMAVLAEQLGVESVAISIFVPGQGATTTPNSTLAPTPARSRLPSRTAAATITTSPSPSTTPMPKFRMLSQEQVCLENAPAPRIEVEVVDADLEPAAGVEVIVEWNGGVDHFFTGFQLERGLGYGDFAMEADIAYQVYLADGSPIINDLRIEKCLAGENVWPGGWRLTFQDTAAAEDRLGESDN